jgi:opacity protein-like surface antigen
MPKNNFLSLFLITILLTFAISTFGQAPENVHPLANRAGDFEFGNFYTGTRDFIELGYGIGKLSNNKIITPFNNLSLSEIIIGRRFRKPTAKYKLIEFNDNYLFSSYVEDYKENTNDNSKISFDIWRFGFGYRKGFGYNLGSMSILPFYHMGIGWNKININLPRIEDTFISADDLLKLNNYDNEIKFGTSNIGGIDFNVSSVISLGASYETAVIFPYYKTWKQLGSFFIETLGQTGVDFLTEGVIIKTVPSITPILYFLLKNGLSYYLFTLKKDEMNWPFKTTSPFASESYKFSLKITL